VPSAFQAAATRVSHIEHPARAFATDAREWQSALRFEPVGKQQVLRQAAKFRTG
jgi:hypothetical protein